MNKIVLFFVFCFIFSSCVSNRVDIDQHPFYIDVSEYNNNVVMEDVFESIKAINLELNDSSVIGKMGKYLIHDSLLFIFDKSDNSILQFNLDGKFISRLSKQGKGDGEYTHIEDFDINPFDTTIDIMSCVGVVYRYNFSGDFIDSYYLPDTRAVHYISNYSKDSVAFYTDLEGDRLTLYSISENRILKRFHKHPNYSIGVSGTPFYRYNDKLVIRDQFGACLKTLSNLNLDEMYCFNYNGKSLEPDQIPEYGAEKLLQDFVTQQLDKIYNYWFTESQTYLINSFIHKGETFIYIYNKAKNRGTLMKKFNNGCKFINSPQFHSSKLFAVIPAHNVNIFFNSDSKKSFDLKILDNLNEYSNPVLVIAKLKE